MATRLLPLLLLWALPTTLLALDFTYTTNNGTITITKYTGPGGPVTIPNSINGLPVSTIGYQAFYKCIEVTGITIPNSVTNIKDSAFQYCMSLTSATIPNSVTSIGSYAFASCTFLANVTIPASVMSIGSETFYNCYTLGTITVDALNSIYSSGDGVLFNKSRTTLIQYPAGKTGSYIMPDSVTSIGNFAFNECHKLTSITMPSGVTAIGDSAFQNCINLTIVMIPDSVTRIGTYAFHQCSRLTTVLIGNSVTNIGDWAFGVCGSLTNMVIPKSVTHIGDSAFRSCARLSAITVDALNSFYISVDGILFNKSQTALIQYPGGKAGTSYVIPNGVTHIGNSALYGCSSLTNITIPNSVTDIGDWAFVDCTGLASITIPDSVTRIGDWAFDYCNHLTDITIPNRVASIGERAFAYCTSMTNATIGFSVTNIGDNAFYCCRSLTSIMVDAQNSAYSSMDGALFNKRQTTLIQYPAGKAGNYTIPGGVTSIGNNAFYYCNLLTNSTIPASVTSIGLGAFSSCASLTGITVDALNSSYSSVDGVLFDKSQTTLIQFPAGKAGNYTIPDSVTGIEYQAFYYCTNLYTTTIPHSVRYIGESAFHNCIKMTSISIGSSVTNIGDFAFWNCYRLTNVKIPDGVTSIGWWAFAYCNRLASVTVGNGVADIGDRAFTGCMNLTGIYFRGSAPSQGIYVFDSSYPTVYYLPGTTGWGPRFGGRPTALWKPIVQATDASFGVQTNQFGFNVSWASGRTVVLEASTDLVNPAWSPLQTNTLSTDSFYFSDPHWTNYPARFYRLRSP